MVRKLTEEEERLEEDAQRRFEEATKRMKEAHLSYIMRCLPGIMRSTGRRKLREED